MISATDILDALEDKACAIDTIRNCQCNWCVTYRTVDQIFLDLQISSEFKEQLQTKVEDDVIG